MNSTPGPSQVPPCPEPHTSVASECGFSELRLRPRARTRAWAQAMCSQELAPGVGDQEQDQVQEPRRTGGSRAGGGGKAGSPFLCTAPGRSWAIALVYSCYLYHITRLDWNDRRSRARACNALVHSSSHKGGGVTGGPRTSASRPFGTMPKGRYQTIHIREPMHACACSRISDRSPECSVPVRHLGRWPRAPGTLCRAPWLLPS